MTETTDRYRKRPIEIEARQLLASDDGEAGRKLAAWCGGWIGGSFVEPRIMIPTLEGEMRATVGDWIIRGVQGEFYPCKPDIFEQSYEPAAAPSASADRAAMLSEAERTMLNYALNQAQLRMWATGKFTDEDQAAVVSLRRMADEAPAQRNIQCTDAFWVKQPHAPHDWQQRPDAPPVYCPGVDGVAPAPSRAADEAQQPETQADDEPPAPLRRSWDDCPGFPEQCPNILPVDPDPPIHYGGIRCGCADQPAVGAQQPKEA